MREGEGVLAYEAYNQLAGDANHPQGLVSLQLGAVNVPLGSPSEVQIAGWSSSTTRV